MQPAQEQQHHQTQQPRSGINAQQEQNQTDKAQPPQYYS